MSNAPPPVTFQRIMGTDVAELVIKAFYQVYNALGYGFLEKVYSNALVIELCRLGLKVVQEARITV